MRVLKNEIQVYRVGRLLIRTACFIILSLVSSGAFSQGQIRTTTVIIKPVTRVLFLLDASGSMAGKWQNENKMTAAKQILSRMSDSLQKENIEFAIRVFGHQSDKKLNDCKDTRLELPFSKNNPALLAGFLARISPKGYSPIALSLEESVKDFPLLKTESKNIIILITDGFENCDGDPCSASERLQNAGVYLRPYIIGLGLAEDQRLKFDCVGEVFEADEKKKDYSTSLSSIIITNIINPTTLQINLLNEAEKPKESNVNMSFFDSYTNDLRYNIYHTINAAGNPDTLYIDHTRSYNAKIHTLPPVMIKDIKLTQGKHTTRAAETPQGTLKFQMSGAAKYKNLKCIVRQNNKIIAVQDAGVTQNYITGTYDLEILTLPPVLLSETAISQSQVKTITIPSPGSVILNKTSAGFATIFKKENDELIKIYTIDPSVNKETIQLQPGNYEILFRATNAQSSKSAVIKKITIVSGMAVNMTI